MNILITPSHNYVMPYGIMLESLFANNESEDIYIYAIIDDDITEEDKNNLDGIANKHHAKPIIYTTFPQDLLKKNPWCRTFSCD